MLRRGSAVPTAWHRRGILDRAIADAAARGATCVEGYPHNEPKANDAAHFRGPRSMYEARGFQPIEVRERYTVMRRSIPSSAKR